MILTKKQARRDVQVFLIIVALLTIIGCIFIYSSSSVFALERYHDATYFIKKQLLGLVIGFIALIGCRYIPLRMIQSLTPWFLFSSLVLTSLTLIPHLARHIHGSSRWLNLGGFSFQPSELLKLALILYIAYFVSKREKGPTTFIKGLLPLLVILAIAGIIVLQQPDFGLLITLLATTMIMLFVAHYHTKYLFYGLLACIPAIIGLIIIKPYRVARVLTFLNPWSDPQGAGFQIIQSLIAIGSGGFFGLGIGQSKQKFFYLPMQCTDFIFSIIAEETGFIGASLLIILFIALLYMGLRLAWHMKSSFSYLSILGFTVVLSLQALINLAVTTGLAPTKGIGLPFISYGNTALVCELAMVGLIMNMVYAQD